jgi:DNA polymerase-1
MSQFLKAISYSPFLAIDTESNGKDYRWNPEARTVGISVAFRPDPQSDVIYDYFAYHHRLGRNYPSEHIDELKPAIEEHPFLIFHNAKHDILALENLGINVRNKFYFCTMLGTHWINENLLSKSLDFASQTFGGKPKIRSGLMKNIIKALGWDWIPSEIMWEYAAHDAYITYELFEKIWPIFRAEGYAGELWDIERDFTKLIMRMEEIGVRVNPDVCHDEIMAGEQRMLEITKSLNDFNPNSPKDLEIILIDCLGLKPYPELTKTGRLAWHKQAMAYYEEELSTLEDHTAELVLEYRGWLKAISAYYRAYLHLQSPEGILHPNFKLHGTRTGRLSCERPNLQQIPRYSAKRWSQSAKRAIRPRSGYILWEADYANLEFRLGAIYANEPNMVEPLKKGFKPFDSMANLIFGLSPEDGDIFQERRQDCKTFTYMTAYGAGPAKIAATMKRDPEWAFKMRDDWWSTYPGMRNTSRLAQRKAEARGYALLWTGRRRHFDDGVGTHKAFNAVIQGGAAELVKRTMLVLGQVIDWDDCKLLLQIHDSCVFEIKIGTEGHWIPIIRQVMEDVSAHHQKFGLVPFPVDVKKWGSK